MLVASRNPGKLREFKALLSGVPFVLVTLTDVGIDQDVPETGSTFEENATIKAESYCRLSGMLTLAEDSGLEVDALAGEPGVYSSRYAGPEADDAARNAFLLSKLSARPEVRWEARYRSVVALARPGRPVRLYSGECPGRIVANPRGDNGFGYDPIFLLPEMGVTMAELPPAEKDRISHRGIAARKALEDLRRMNHDRAAI
jgi:XTP/dITP diphosphohydrolase